MQVLHVISDENIGGAGVLLLNLLRCFEGSKIKCLVALPSASRLKERLQGLSCKVFFNCSELRRIAILAKNTLFCPAEEYHGFTKLVFAPSALIMLQ